MTIPQKNPTRPARAFTIIELMVVVSIIVVLVGLLLPATKRSLDTAKEGSCASNVRQIGIGMINYNTDTRYLPSSYPRYAAMSVNKVSELCVAWPAQIRLYATGGNAIFYCPIAESSTKWNTMNPDSGNPARYGYAAGEYWVAANSPGGTSYGHNNDGTRSHASLVAPVLGLSDDPDNPNAYCSLTVVRQPSQFICIGDSRIDGIWDAFIDYTDPGEDLATRHHGGAYLVFGDGHVAWVNSPEYKDNSFCLCIDPMRGRMWNNDFIYP